MTHTQYAFIAALLHSIWADKPTQSASEWCCETLQFDEPDNHGPFTLSGREYSREPIDCVADPAIHKTTMVFGSQTGKTVIIMGRTAWLIFNEGARIFWVMPVKDLVSKFSSTRWSKLLRASPKLAALIPSGARRHDFSTFQQRLGQAIVDFVWSNSPSALSSTPARVVNLDEVDKFPEATAKEADAVSLAEQRTKDFAVPKITATSTPTTVEGVIWQRYLQSDQRRRQVPCYSCKKHVLFVWSKDFTVFPLTGMEALVVWDKEAKRKNGSWDLERVEKSARMVCPHCGFHILDAHKTWMDRNGLWVPSERRAKSGNDEISAERGHRGYHLPSLYSSKRQCNTGLLAVKFIQQSRGLQGLQGFINGDLAEPEDSQESRTQRVEIIIRATEPRPQGAEFLTVDVQEKSPHFHFVRQLWAPGVARVLEAGSCETGDEIREIQLLYKIPDTFVGIDSGDDTDAVYALCARFGQLRVTAERKRAGKPPLHVGWIPIKGFKTAGWLSPETKAKALFKIQPLERNIGGRVIAIPLLEIADGPLKDVLSRLRKGKTSALRWEVADDVATDEFWRDMDSERKVRVYNKRTGFSVAEWQKRSKHWPNEKLDCCKTQIAMALFHRKLVDIGTEAESEKEEKVEK